MKKTYRHFAVLGSMCTIASLCVLWFSVITMDWVIIQEPLTDQLDLDKGFEPEPHIIRATFGLFKMCIQHESPNSRNFNTLECHDLQWTNFGIINFAPERKAPKMPTELIAVCVEKLRFTLPFIFLSLLFTSLAFLCMSFGHFCNKNKKIIEATCLIMGGLCQATALLTFVSQIGSSFEANLPYMHHATNLTTYFHYKYGFSFYLFLLSFSLSEMGALLAMISYFRKNPPNRYVITFSRQEPSPFLSHPAMTNSLDSRTNHNSHNNSHHQHDPNFNSRSLPHYGHKQQFRAGPDICINNDFGSEHIDLTVSTTRMNMGNMGENPNGGGGIIHPFGKDSYINPEVTVQTIERNTFAGIRNPKVTNPTTMESFGTLQRKENNI